MFHSRQAQRKGRQSARNRRPLIVSMSAYFRLAIAVRSNLPETTKEEPHQLEPKPPGLIEVKSPVNRAVLSLVKAENPVSQATRARPPVSVGAPPPPVL